MVTQHRKLAWLILSFDYCIRKGGSDQSLGVYPPKGGSGQSLGVYLLPLDSLKCMLTEYLYTSSEISKSQEYSEILFCTP